MAASSPSSLLLACRVVDTILLFFFLVIAVAAPLIDGQTCLPSHLFPKLLVDLKSWYGHEYGDYLTMEKPYFFVGIVWLELLFQWPLAIANIYGIVTGRQWYQTTCLMYGISTCSGMVAIMGELIGSGRASQKLLAMYLPFLAVSVVATLRGLIPYSSIHGKSEATKKWV
ncbi:uncharacterized protein [Aristolochia californica]|uniref:uncharacterized protein n=1 Tax=Aristolochia californica TaxID=171875 RepID=UPI0035E0C9C0